MGDTEEIIKCPACDNEMQKIFITDKGINTDVAEYFLTIKKFKNLAIKTQIFQKLNKLFLIKTSCL